MIMIYNDMQRYYDMYCNPIPFKGQMILRVMRSNLKVGCYGMILYAIQ
jgi:hypothetical protein